MLDEIAINYCKHDIEETNALFNRIHGAFKNGVGYSPLKIEKVIFNNPATIVIWSDGTKTVVKCDCYNEPFDEEKGLAMAISKKFLGNKGNYYNEFKKWLPKIEEDMDDNLSIKLPVGELYKNVCENIRNSFKNDISRKKHPTL